MISKKIYSRILLVFILVIFNNQLVYSQYCLAVGPSSTADSNIEFVSISGESGSSINHNGCPGVSGLNDLTSTESVDLLQGNSYSLTIQFGTCGGNYNGAGEAWIDFNQNDVFDASESLGTWSGLPPTAVSVFNFTVPGATPDGQARLRIIQQEGTSLPLNPCANFTWGSATDFLVNFGPPIDCSAYIGDDMSDPRIVSTIPYTESHDNDFCYSNVSEVYVSPDVFYRIIPSQLGITEFNVSLCGSSFDTYLEVLDTDTNVVANNDDYGPCAPQSELSFNSGNHDTLFIVVQGWSNEQGNYTIEINNGEFTSVIADEFEYQLFPNPVNDLLSVSGISGYTEIQFISLNGQIALTDKIDQDASLDLSYLESGIYLVRLTNNGKVSHQKITVL